ncbi:MAG TPA: 2-oxoglutarate dehydrogenase complex dihydrolipoyllysine-residue succinyltransferase [Gammaproteobacteria bacterium]|nr:2-oxoglutarate dehydrogenase complex dihydrolipoyllysine-residue succinyltransferase [Gammaproteobacteria bacterium]
MSIEVKVPPLPESVSEATIATWHKQPGDTVRRDENLVDIETDKVVLEVPAPADGVLAEVLAGEGDTVTAGQLLARLQEQGAAVAAAKPAEPAAEPAARTAAMPTNTEDLSPAVRRLVAEHGLDPAQIPATGRDGRLTKEDVLNFMEAGTGSAGDSIRPRGTSAAEPEAAPAVVQPAAKAAPAQPSIQVQPLGERAERRVPMTRLRQRIAERLVEAQHNAAMLTTFNEVNMKPLMDLRAKYRDVFEKTHDTKLGFMSFFVKASIEALKRFPAVNASIDGTDVIYHGYYDIGIAVSTPRGLVVPIIRDADRLSMADVEKAVVDYGTRARDGKLSIDELSGGTFSITNGGIFGSLLSTPILNPPQSGILGMHKIQDRPVVVGGQIVIRPMMYLALSYDHRIVDGKEAVTFLVRVKESLEDPERLVLDL